MCEQRLKYKNLNNYILFFIKKKIDTLTNLSVLLEKIISKFSLGT